MSENKPTTSKVAGDKKTKTRMSTTAFQAQTDQPLSSGIKDDQQLDVDHSDVEPPTESHDKRGGHDKKREQPKQTVTKKTPNKQITLEDLMSPAAEQYVRRWLQSAQPTERAVAMDIFAKAAGTKKTERENYSSFQSILDEIKM
ncbi:hypothetical protein P879_05549 [Paragonimus westermani]|uniref:Uncharacterized protein n=1 Tax=Paragonimus westermani TaxID=34504 RepID=A0A8T0DDI8_9TREM|nr:hypothetical protein P879_05549 [Paragonimus westermani]